MRRQVRLGQEADGWTRRRAEEELQAVLADLRRGRPNEIAAPPHQKPDPLFAEFAHEWFEGVSGELAPTTIDRGQILRHLLPFFGRHRLTQITVQEVDRYKHAKVREASLSASRRPEACAGEGGGEGERDARGGGTLGSRSR